MRAGGDDGAAAAHRLPNRRRIPRIDRRSGDPGHCRKPRQRRAVDITDEHVIVTAIGQQPRNRAANFPRAKQENRFHDRRSFVQMIPPIVVIASGWRRYDGIKHDTVKASSEVDVSASLDLT